jgi:hypothetical protein
MVLVLLVEKSGTIKEINVKQFDEIYLSKRQGLNLARDFRKLMDGILII